MNEEAIASELAAYFFLERGLHEKSYSLFMNSVECYKKWGALAVAQRVETTIQNKLGSDITHLADLTHNPLMYNLASEGRHSNKRQSQDIDRYCEYDV